MNTLIPIWIIGGPFVAMVILAFSFRGPSAMGGSRAGMPRRGGAPADLGAPLSEPMHPEAPRRHV